MAKNKGVIDYSNETTIATPIVKEISKLSTNQISAPINLGQNWALVKLLGKRKAVIKSYQESKNSIAKSLAAKAIRRFNDELIKDSKLKITVK